MNRRFLALIAVSVVVTGFPRAAAAYLDPGTGGLIYQIGFAFFSLIVGWLLFPLQVIKDAWTRLKRRCKRNE